MTDSLVIFTFSPIQSFIAEARRVADLYVGSRVLCELAKAAAQAFGEKQLIYPASLGEDTPNLLVARVPATEAAALAARAEGALRQRWQQLAREARDRFATEKKAPTDATWDAIWTQQTNAVWDVFWVASDILEASDAGYRAAYRLARDALDAVKRSRLFDAATEMGDKDSLSGQRTALYTAEQMAKPYWTMVSQLDTVKSSELRPFGRERLDALGVVKRFSRLSDFSQFFSTSSVATADFLERARPHLRPYNEVVRKLLYRYLYPVRNDPDWPYDGDLLFMETLAANRLQDSYGINPDTIDESLLATARTVLARVYGLAKSRPSAYYAIIQLDGDSIGRHISSLLSQEQPESAHRSFSRHLTEFATEAKDLVRTGFAIYNGGDDVLALTPLRNAIPLAQTLAASFYTLTNVSASAGIAITHHLSPLSAALVAARQAEREAKQVDGKAAMCIKVLKRSGETVTARSSWDALGNNLAGVIEHFESGSLSSRLIYDVKRATYAVGEAGAMFQAELRRLLARHDKQQANSPLDVREEAHRLNEWASRLPDQAAELSQWLAVARFMAQKGGD